MRVGGALTRLLAAALVDGPPLALALPLPFGCLRCGAPHPRAVSSERGAAQPCYRNAASLTTQLHAKRVEQHTPSPEPPARAPPPR
jgi:hypothetical protein